MRSLGEGFPDLQGLSERKAVSMTAELAIGSTDPYLFASSVLQGTASATVRTAAVSLVGLVTVSPCRG
jgi:hypothetical protein